MHRFLFPPCRFTVHPGNLLSITTHLRLVQCIPMGRRVASGALYLHLFPPSPLGPSASTFRCFLLVGLYVAPHVQSVTVVILHNQLAVHWSLFFTTSHVLLPTILSLLPIGSSVSAPAMPTCFPQPSSPFPTVMGSDYLLPVSVTSAILCSVDPAVSHYCHSPPLFYCQWRPVPLPSGYSDVCWLPPCHPPLKGLSACPPLWCSTCPALALPG